MRTSRTLISLLLVTLMLVASVAPFASFADEKVDDNTTVSASKMLSDEELPKSFTLVGTTHLPPISNQGQVGSCASQSIAYEQMTNAVSRYLHSIDPDIEWDPSSGNLAYIMSPKFTYDLSGSGTAWVYNILMDHGAATMANHSFVLEEGTNAQRLFKNATSNKYFQYTQSTEWYVKQGELLEALKIRLKNWTGDKDQEGTTDKDQIWIRRTSFNDENGNVMITKTAEGKALLNKIKNYLNNGNVVVTGGLSGAWRYEKLTASGDIGKKGEHCLAWAHSDQTGGHQVSIVGYDDNVECTVNGATMKGAFLVANSWGTTWMNKGYVWLMYDALNSKSEFDAINKKWPDRYIAMDQFCFTDWETDIEIGLPELMVQVEVEAEYREAVAINLVRKGGASKELIKKPWMFQYGLTGSNYHSDYGIENAKYSFSGYHVEDLKKAEKGYFTLSYGELFDNMEEGMTFEDYQWGCSVYSVHGYPINIKSIKLINSNQDVLAEIDIPDEGIKMPEKEVSFHSGKNTARKDFLFDVKSANLPTEESVSSEGKYTIEYQNSGLVVVGTNVSFKLTEKEGFKVGEVKVNGKVIEPVDGVYTFVAEAENKIEVAEYVPAEPTPTPTPAPGGDSDNTTTIVIVVVVCVVVVCGVVVAVVVASKKKKNG